MCALRSCWKGEIIQRAFSPPTSFHQFYASNTNFWSFKWINYLTIVINVIASFYSILFALIFNVMTVLLLFYGYINCWLLHSFCPRCYYLHHHRCCCITPLPSSSYRRRRCIAVVAVLLSMLALSPPPAISCWLLHCWLLLMYFFLVAVSMKSITIMSSPLPLPLFFRCAIAVIITVVVVVAFVVDCCVCFRGWLLLFLAFVCVLCVFSRKKYCPDEPTPLTPSLRPPRLLRQMQCQNHPR